MENINTCKKIIAVEASPNTFNLLVSNCKTNSNIICENYVVCNSDDDYITFYEANADTLSTINKKWLTEKMSRFYNHPFREIKCKTIKLDDLIDKYGIPNLIKIDVEGGEYECIASLSRKVNLLCFEWASETNDISFKCLDYLFNLGFRHFFLQYQHLYTFRPNEFYDIDKIKDNLKNTIAKVDWGMIWCK